MKNILFALSLGLFTSIALAADQPPPLPIEMCKAHLPYGMIGTLNKDTIVCRTGYALEHDNTAKIPKWVAWTVTPDHAIGCAERVDAFAADQSLPSAGRAEPKDYAGTGYDKGHLANNADLSWDSDVARESFYMSNMSPQLPALNRGTWKDLEASTRAWVYQTKHSHTIYAGNIYTASSKTIGASKVVVPETLFKIVTDNETKVSYAYIMPNKSDVKSDYDNYQTTVFEVERASGMLFNVPGDKDLKQAPPEPDLKTIMNDKKRICK